MPKKDNSNEPYAESSSTRAKAKAYDMLDDLKDQDGWKVVVHENLGWHTHLRKGALKLYRHHGLYSTLLGDTPECGGGSVSWSIDYRHRDPNLVIAKQLRVARDYVRKCLESIESAE